MKIAIENCPMIFSWDEWPGGTNLASTPAVWDEMFSIVDSGTGGLRLQARDAQSLQELWDLELTPAASGIKPGGLDQAVEDLKQDLSRGLEAG